MGRLSRKQWGTIATAISAALGVGFVIIVECRGKIEGGDPMWAVLTGSMFLSLWAMRMTRDSESKKLRH